MVEVLTKRFSKRLTLPSINTQVSDKDEKSFATVDESALKPSQLRKYFDYYSRICLEYVSDLLYTNPRLKPKRVTLDKELFKKGQYLTRQHAYF